MVSKAEAENKKLKARVVVPEERSITRGGTSHGGVAMPLSVQLDSVEKFFGNRCALQGVSFAVEAGSVFGLLGPNGAGKSTTLRILAGLVRCSAGTVRLLEVDPWTERAMLVGKVGVLLDAVFPQYLSARQNLALLGYLAGASKEEQGYALRYVGLERVAQRQVSSFSFGMTQRLGLAQALLGKPGVLILDEPMVGLDPSGIADLKELLLKLARDHGVTVLLSSHQLSDVEDICDEIAVVNHGRTIYAGSVKEATGFVGYRLLVDNVSFALADLSCLGYSATIEGTQLVVRVEPGNDLADLVNHLVSAGHRIFHVEPIRNTLYDLFIREVGGMRDVG